MTNSPDDSIRPARVTFHTKPGCPLCDEALAEVESARRQHDFTLEVINILDSLETYEHYKHAVPVVSVNGSEVFRYRLTTRALLQEIALRGPAD